MCVAIAPWFRVVRTVCECSPFAGCLVRSCGVRRASSGDPTVLPRRHLPICVRACSCVRLFHASLINCRPLTRHAAAVMS